MVMLKKFPLVMIRLIMVAAIFALTMFQEVSASTTKESSPPGNNRSKLENNVLPAKGRQETILSVDTFGRYAVRAKSLQGTALQLVDKMAGPGEITGIAGESDGRLDLFLERGKYKIVTFSHEKGEGQFKLESFSFTELNTPNPPRLIEYKIVETTLDDFQQRSWWLEIKERQVVNIEAAGRNLEDFRLWKDGTWLVDAMPTTDLLEPKTGEQLRCRRFTVDLQPGYYLLTAYGGPAEKWAKETDAHPLYLRMGIPEISEADRRRYSASPFGIDRWKVPGSANFFRLELEKSEEAYIDVNDFNQKSVFISSGAQGSINKKSRLPVAEITSYSNDKGYHLLTIRREAGKPYILQHFKSVYSYYIDGSGRYWISTIHSGHGEDSVDATAMLTEIPRHSRERLLDSSVIQLDGYTAWERRFNLLEPLTMYLEVKEGYSYVVEGSGAKALFRIEPFLTYRPRNYKSPKFKESGETWTLDPGFYVLTANPENDGKGILNLKIYAQRTAIVQGLLDLKKKASNYFNSSDTSKLKAVPAQTHVRFESVNLNRDSSYRLYINRQPGVRAGVILRRLPVNLEKSLPVTLAPGEMISIPVSIPEAGKVTAVAEDGSRLKSFMGDKWDEVHSVTGGSYSVQVRNNNKRTINFSLILTRKRFAQETPLPQLASQPELPAFPVLEKSTPHYLDTERREAKTFKVRVDAPGLYRLETTGLLQTEGNVRTRTNPSLFRASNNGVGRNFLIQQYLREGDYQLSVTPEGETKGHYGLRLSGTRLHKGGLLTDGIAARYSLPAGEGLVYRFEIKEKGRYLLKSLGLSRSFLIRLDDGDGWPLIKPGTAAGLSRELLPGSYTYTILPQPVESRVITLLEKVVVSQKYEGHGPHNMVLNQSVSHRWMEPDEGQERKPDQWFFHTPASVNVQIALSDDMEATLFQIGTSGQVKERAKFTGRQDWKGLLEKGKYSLNVRSIRANNLLDYSMSLSAKELVEGQKKSVRAPGEITVAVGKDTLIELSSFGSEDILARLYNNTGKLLAQSDDRPDDWNFHMAKKLVPGHYRLRVEPVASSSALTEVSMYLPREVQDSPLTLPADISFRDRALHYYSLNIPAGDEVLLFSVFSGDTAGVALEKEVSGRWTTIGSSMGKNPVLAVPSDKRSGGDRYRLRLWSVDRRGASVKLQARAISLTAEKEKVLTRSGVTLNPVRDIDMPVGVAVIDIETPGLFKVEREIGHLTWATEGGQGLSSNGSGLISAGGRKLWIMDRLPDNLPVSVKVKRVVLTDGEELKCDVPSAKDLVVNHHSGNWGPKIVLADSQMGQPGIAFGVDGRAAVHNLAAMGIAGQSAVTVNLTGSAVPVRVWNAGKRGMALPITVRQFTFEKPISGELPWGIRNMELAGKKAYEYKLPAGKKQMAIALPESTVAVLTKSDNILETIWAGKEKSYHSISNDADKLHLFNLAKKQSFASLTFSPLKSEESQALIDSSQLFKRHFSSAAVLHGRINLKRSEKQKGLTLNISGPEAEGLVLDENGTVKRGNVLLVEGNSFITIEHGPGLVTAWLSSADDSGLMREAGRKAIEVRAPSQVPLRGNRMILKLDQQVAEHVILTTDVPVTARFASATGQTGVKVFPDGANLSLYLPRGASYVSLDSTGHGELQGFARLLTREISAIGEGLGPAMLLPPGGARMFSFQVKGKGPVGIGVKASADIVSCRLFDSEGKLIGNGVVQMHNLAPGKYIMEVYSPADSEAVQIQPAVVGIIPPDTGPPENVIRKYLEMAGLKLK